MAIAPAMNVGKRRLVYGLNVVLTCVLALLAAALVVWAAGRFGGRVDVSSRGANSLSPRTIGLIRELDTDVKLTGLYTTALKEIDPLQEKRFDQVADLLRLYETTGRGRIIGRMLDPSRDEARVRETLLALASKPVYQEETRPHREALEAFPALNARIAELINAELTELDRLAQLDPALAGATQLTALRRSLDDALQQAQRTAKEVQEYQQEEIPRYGAATGAATSHLTAIQTVLQGLQEWMHQNGASLPGISPDTQRYFRTAQDRFAPLLTEVGELLSKMQGLERVKLEDLYDRLSQGQTILVETADGAEVLALDDVWPYRMDQNAPAPADGDPREFTGEQAVSSAILKLTQKEKTAVIFVRAGGQPLLSVDFNRLNLSALTELPRAPYGQLNELLEQQNFITAEWDVIESVTPPEVPEASRRVYVVFPPPPPQRPDPMRPPPPSGLEPAQREAILDAVDQAGMAIFLAGWSPPMVSGGNPFASYLRDQWGIAVKSEYMVAHFTPHPQKPGFFWPVRRDVPLLTGQVVRLTDHPIGKPIQALPLGMYMVAPLEIVAPGTEAAADSATASAPADGAATRPAGSPPPDVKREPVVVVAETEDVWASSDIIRVINQDLRVEQGTKRRDEDIAPPFPIAVAATRGDGDRIVVFGSEQFASDELAQARGLTSSGGGLVLYTLYPGNSELFINALHWLTGESNRISVGARAADVPRLERLKEGPAAVFWRVFLVGIWPAIALAVGVGVALARRR